MKKPEVVECSRLKVALRKDFYDSLRGPIQELLDLTGADYFTHQLIENYYQPNHFVSSFNTHEDWQDTQGLFPLEFGCRVTCHRQT